MDRLLVWVSLLLTYRPVTGSTGKNESCLLQPNSIMWHKTGQSALLTCTVSSHCSARDVRYEWFSFKENCHHHLNLQDNPLKYMLEGASLQIRSLQANDSGIYHCAASRQGRAPGTEHVGSGTTLVVREHVKIMVRHILLWISFVLLAIYSLVVVTLILRKCRGNMSICRKTHRTGKKGSTKTTQFRDVLQEMYNRRNFGRKQTVSRSRCQVEVKLQHVKAASPEFKSPTDDIYQNV